MTEAPHHLMLFDGVCHLCSGTVQRVLAADRRGLIRFTPIQSPYGRALAAAHGLDADNPDSFVFFTGGRPRLKSDGALALAAVVGAPWSWLGVLRLIPAPLRDWAYDRVARNRYRLFGRDEVCMVPTPQVAARFVLEAP